MSARAQAPAGRPDVTLRLVFPREPALVLTNGSDNDARAISWTMSLWNTSRSAVGGKLPIAPGAYELVKAHDESGAIRLFDDDRMKALLKPGDRLFGSASVQCVPCRGGHSYVVNIAWGEGGWFAEVKGGGAVLVPADLRKETLDAYFASLDALAAGASKQSIADQPAAKAGVITRRISARAAVQKNILYIMNVGPSAFRLRGLEFDDDGAGVSVDRKLEIGGVANFPLDALVQRIGRTIGDNSSIVVPLRADLTGGGDDQKFTMRATLEFVRKGGALDVKAVNLGVFEGGG